MQMKVIQQESDKVGEEAIAQQEKLKEAEIRRVAKEEAKAELLKEQKAKWLNDII